MSKDPSASTPIPTSTPTPTPTSTPTPTPTSTPTTKGRPFSLDAWALIVAMLLALAVKFDVFKNVTW